MFYDCSRLGHNFYHPATYANMLRWRPSWHQLANPTGNSPTPIFKIRMPVWHGDVPYRSGVASNRTRNVNNATNLYPVQMLLQDLRHKCRPNPFLLWCLLCSSCSHNKSIWALRERCLLGRFPHPAIGLHASTESEPDLKSGGTRRLARLKNKQCAIFVLWSYGRLGMIRPWGFSTVLKNLLLIDSVKLKK